MITVVFVDVDGTLVDEKDNVRPWVKGLFNYLKHADCSVVVWSAGGQGYAERKMEMIGRKLEFDFTPLVDAYLWKVDGQSVYAESRFYIDDAEGLIDAMKLSGYGTFLVPFYCSSAEAVDNWLLKAAEAVEHFIDARDSGEVSSDDGD